MGLPDYKNLSNYQPPISSRVYSDNGKLIAEYALQKRLFVPYRSIPEVVINSFCLQKIRIFQSSRYRRKRDFKTVLNNLKTFLKTNVLKELYNNSTSRQKLSTNEVSIKRKIKEAILAFRIERAYSKEKF